jgi:5,10-methylenetetrahydromethanopterin reductase
VDGRVPPQLLVARPRGEQAVRAPEPARRLPLGARRLSLEFGNVLFCPPLQGGRLAAEDEALGFDIRYFGDNSCYGSDPFVELREAARTTSRIRLAVGATNFVTRHPSVIANGIAGVQLASGGRAICGIATGDSALGVIGRRPQKLAEFVEDATALRRYLHGQTVRLGGWDSSLRWLGEVEAYTPVPIEVMCSGPRALAAAASVADRITLTVGAAPERIAWALDVLDEALAAAGRGRGDVEVGAFVALALDDDRGRAVERLRVRVKGQAHMASHRGVDLDAQPERLRGVTRRLREEYDYRHHDVRPDNPLGQLIEPEFADWFGVGGSPAYAVERLGRLAEAGLGYVFVAGLLPEERERLAADVMPQLKSATLPGPR